MHRPLNQTHTTIVPGERCPSPVAAASISHSEPGQARVCLPFLRRTDHSTLFTYPPTPCPPLCVHCIPHTCYGFPFSFFFVTP